MLQSLRRLRSFLLDIFFPKTCVNCGQEGFYLCQDCLSLIDIWERQYCPFCFPPIIVMDGKTCNFCRKSKKLSGLFCAASYENFVIKKLIRQFKYSSFVKDLSATLASLIILHFDRARVFFDPQSFVLMPVPLYGRKLRSRGYNQAEELAKELSQYLKIPLLNNVLFKTKNTFNQMELKREERMKNIAEAFACKNQGLVKNKKVLLVDDVLTTGATLEECARVLKQAGAREVWGVVVARG